MAEQVRQPYRLNGMKDIGLSDRLFVCCTKLIRVAVMARQRLKRLTIKGLQNWLASLQ
ncbi:MAG: hypothetical protein F6K40_20305 [Okeania sp. SIO3I5]|uniref:hypothetical protein n=1 Tax=Okeania sp. SIO3I5 TaxID=2607805 RepID=UPI0013B885C6|nr:hypothetical protein [Okeania sp. SIO3I5]NEQ38483.1 hypothetical protein [Okeania sp. SIO3I5]